MKQIPLFTLLLLVFPFSVLCQESTDKFRIGIGYSPYAVLKKEKVNDVKGTYSSSFGINSSVKCTERLRLDFAVHFSNRKYIQNDLKFGQNLNPQTGAYDTTFSFNYSSKFIEIPVTLSYQMSVSERTSFFVSLGVSQQISIKQSNDWTAFPASGNSIVDYKNEKNQYNLSATGANLSIGFGYKLNDQYHLQFEPFLRNYFTQKTKYITHKTNSLLGLNAAVFYCF